jgi:hypothetical protein
LLVVVREFQVQIGPPLVQRQRLQETFSTLNSIT